MSVEKASELVRATKATGYAWLKAWNSSGYRGLKPRFTGSKHPKLSEKQKEELKKMPMKKDSWTTSEHII
jgi:putative transposase